MTTNINPLPLLRPTVSGPSAPSDPRLIGDAQAGWERLGSGAERALGRELEARHAEEDRQDQLNAIAATAAYHVTAAQAWDEARRGAPEGGFGLATEFSGRLAQMQKDVLAQTPHRAQRLVAGRIAEINTALTITAMQEQSRLAASSEDRALGSSLSSFAQIVRMGGSVEDAWLNYDRAVGLSQSRLGPDAAERMRVDGRSTLALSAVERHLAANDFTAARTAMDRYATWFKPEQINQLHDRIDGRERHQRDEAQAGWADLLKNRLAESQAGNIDATLLTPAERAMLDKHRPGQADIVQAQLNGAYYGGGILRDLAQRPTAEQLARIDQVMPAPQFGDPAFAAKTEMRGKMIDIIRRVGAERARDPVKFWVENDPQMQAAQKNNDIAGMARRAAQLNQVAQVDSAKLLPDETAKGLVGRWTDLPGPQVIGEIAALRAQSGEYYPYILRQLRDMKLPPYLQTLTLIAPEDQGDVITSGRFPGVELGRMVPDHDKTQIALGVRNHSKVQAFLQVTMGAAGGAETAQNVAKYYEQIEHHALWLRTNGRAGSAGDAVDQAVQTFIGKPVDLNPRHPRIMVPRYDDAGSRRTDEEIRDIWAGLDAAKNRDALTRFAPSRPEKVAGFVVPSAVSAAIEEAAAKTGVAPSVLYAMAALESSFDVRAGLEKLGRFPDPNIGLFQWSKKDLNWWRSKHPDIVGDHLDPKAQALAAGYRAAAAIQTLTAELGRPPTAAEIWLTHGMGEEGSRQFRAGLRANPAAPGISVFNAKAAHVPDGHKPFFFDGAGQPVSAQEAMNRFARRLDPLAEQFRRTPPLHAARGGDAVIAGATHWVPNPGRTGVILAAPGAQPNMIYYPQDAQGRTLSYSFDQLRELGRNQPRAPGHSGVNGAAPPNKYGHNDLWGMEP